MRYKLIITADDYGMCDSVNRAIDACMAAGVVLSTNIMVNMELAEEAKLLKSKFPNASVGIHYNFTVGKPILPQKSVPSLVDETGEFLTYSEIREKCKSKTYLYKEVSAEMRAQFERYVDICGMPDYWNTHENVHVYPGLYQLFRDVSLELGIHKMRTHKRIYVPASDGKSVKGIKWTLTNPIKQALLSNWQKSSSAKGIHAPDGLLVRMNETDKLNLSYLFSHIEWKNNHVAEIAIHPSTDGNNKYFGEITDLRVREYQIYKSPNVIDIAMANHIQLAGFESV